MGGSWSAPASTSTGPRDRRPETQAPETQAPETQAPETQAPETQAPETWPRRTSSAAAGRPVPRAELLVESLLALDRLYGRWDHVSRLYRQTCATVGRQVTVLLQAGVPPWWARRSPSTRKAASSFGTRAGGLVEWLQAT